MVITTNYANLLSDRYTRKTLSRFSDKQYFSASAPRGSLETWFIYALTFTNCYLRLRVVPLVISCPLTYSDVNSTRNGIVRPSSIAWRHWRGASSEDPGAVIDRFFLYKVSPLLFLACSEQVTDIWRHIETQSLQFFTSRDHSINSLIIVWIELKFKIRNVFGSY